MWSLFRLLFAFALLFKTLTAFSLESPADRRVLVLLDDLALESSHSVFFNSLRSRDFELDIKLADDPNLALQRYGEYLYDALLLFSPSSERFGGSVNQAAVIDFIDSGRDLIMAADTNASDLIRNIASEYGVDFDKDAGAMVMDPTSYADSATEGDHTLIASDAFVKFDVILGNNKIEAPVLFQGIGHSINPKYGLLLGGLEVLSASPSAYSANPKSKLLRAPSLTGSAISFVSVVLARNKGRTLITGSLSMFSNKFFSSAVLKTGSPKKYEKSGNEQFLTELSKWVFHERGNLKAVNVKHNKVGEVDERAMYRINDDLEYSFEIFEWSGKSWEPYVADDVQVQFYMMSRYISKTLSTDKKGRYYTSFKVPDVYGVFNFKVEYQRIGYTSVSLRKQIAGFFIFTFVHMYHK